MIGPVKPAIAYETRSVQVSDTTMHASFWIWTWIRYIGIRALTGLTSVLSTNLGSP